MEVGGEWESSGRDMGDRTIERERERDGEHRRIKTYVLVAFRGGIMWPNATRSSPGSVVAEVEKTKKMWRS